jgi:peptide/nickel transport system substrate-binding protein
VVGLSAAPTTVNELLARSSNVNGEMTRLLFLHLLEEQPDFERHPPTFTPRLAASYQWSADHKTLTFELRPDAVWSDGVPVTADDVRFTWQAQVSPALAWESSFYKSAILDVEVVAPKTVRFHFDHAYAKQLLDVNEGPILPRHVWGKLPFAAWRDRSDWFREHLVVSGPFTLESWNPQQQVVLKRNERYFDRGRPYLDRVVLRVSPEQNALSTQLQSGEVDFATLTSPNDASRLAKDPQIDLRHYWSRTWVAMAWNCERPPFDRPEVRRALTLSIDREAIVEALWGPYGRVAVSPVGGSIWAHDPALQPLPYDLAEAKRLLAAAGFADHDGDGILDRGGKPFAFEMITNAGNQQRVDAMVMIQEQLKRAGIRATPRQIEFNSFNAQIRSGEFDAMLFGLTVDTGIDMTDPLGSAKLAGEPNYARYANDEMDRLIRRSLEQIDFEHAKPFLLEIQRLQHRDQPYTSLWESQRFHAIRRRIAGAEPSVLFALSNLEDWWIAQGS